MKAYLISQFIDDEMNIDEKMEFVKTVNENQDFTSETLSFLEQEKLIEAPMVTEIPSAKRDIRIPRQWNTFSFFLPPLAGFAAALILAAVAVTFWPGPPAEHPVPHRFVIYRPAARSAEIIGTFTNWQPAPMEKLGDTGYWTLTLNLPEGEYRYSYLVENGHQIPDPTILIREKDDFGGVNSILKIGGQA